MDLTSAPPRFDRLSAATRTVRELGAFLLLLPAVLTAGATAYVAIWASAFPQAWPMVALLGLAAATMVGLLVAYRRVTAQVPDVRGVALWWVGFALLNPATWWLAVVLIGGM